MKSVRVVAGMNSVRCPVCRRESRDAGTLFIPVNMNMLARLRCRSSQTVSVKGSCNHVVEVKVQSAGMAA